MKAETKRWLKKNWGYVVYGTGMAAVIGAVIFNVVTGGDPEVIDPFVIDRAKDDWMDILVVPVDNGENEITVRQLLAQANLSSFILESLRTMKVLAPDMEEAIKESWAIDHSNMNKVLIDL